MIELAAATLASRGRARLRDWARSTSLALGLKSDGPCAAFQFFVVPLRTNSQ
jgi:hypothetical protein